MEESNEKTAVRGDFYVRDFEDRIWDLIESENRAADFSTDGFRYPRATGKFGDVTVFVLWQVENIYCIPAMVSFYTQIRYSATIEGTKGGFAGELPAKYERVVIMK
jgi:hypothetical protein